MKTTIGTNAQVMHGMPAGLAARHGSASAYGWHATSCPVAAVVFTDTTKRPARWLSEAPL